MDVSSWYELFKELKMKVIGEVIGQDMASIRLKMWPGEEQKSMIVKEKDDWQDKIEYEGTTWEVAWVPFITAKPNEP